MAAAPWYLLAAGVVVVVLGLIVASLERGSGSQLIDPKMSDKEIARRMKDGQGISWGGVLMVIGFVAVLVSVVWRIVRVFV